MWLSGTQSTVLYNHAQNMTHLCFTAKNVLKTTISLSFWICSSRMCSKYNFEINKNETFFFWSNFLTFQVKKKSGFRSFSLVGGGKWFLPSSNTYSCRWCTPQHTKGISGRVLYAKKWKKTSKNSTANLYITERFSPLFACVTQK
jgi:hypothetical protein